MFHYGFAEKDLKQKRSECPFKLGRTVTPQIHVMESAEGHCWVVRGMLRKKFAILH